MRQIVDEMWMAIVEVSSEKMWWGRILLIKLAFA